jgi:oligopeptide transport system substrate-binding protein
VRFVLASDPQLDPALARDLPSLNAAQQVFSGLTRFEGKRVVPDLAERWSVSDNGRVWTFVLRRGLRWSDGTPLVAADFRYAWLRALDPLTAAPYAQPEMLNIYGARAFRRGDVGPGAVGIRTPDSHTLRVTLQHAVPWLDQQAAYPTFFPVPQRLVERFGAGWTAPGRIVSSGPFRLVRRGPRVLVLAKSRSYWDSKDVAPARVVLEIGPRTRASRFDGVLPLELVGPGFQWSSTARIDRRYRPLPTLSVAYLWFAPRQPALGEAPIRRALSSAIDRRALVRNVLRGRGKPLAGFASPEVEGYQTIAPQRVEQADPAKLRPLLEGLRLNLYYASSDPTAPEVAAAIRSDLARVGVSVELVRVSTRDDLVALARPRPHSDVDLVLLGWSGEFFDAYNFFDIFTCSSGINIGWCDHSFDRLMHRTVRTLDDDDRYRLERRLERMLEDGAPAAPLYAVTNEALLRPWVKEFNYSPLGFIDLSRIRIGRRR